MRGEGSTPAANSSSAGCIGPQREPTTRSSSTTLTRYAPQRLHIGTTRTQTWILPTRLPSLSSVLTHFARYAPAYGGIPSGGPRATSWVKCPSVDPHEFFDEWGSPERRPGERRGPGVSRDIRGSQRRRHGGGPHRTPGSPPVTGTIFLFRLRPASPVADGTSCCGSAGGCGSVGGGGPAPPAGCRSDGPVGSDRFAAGDRAVRAADDNAGGHAAVPAGNSPGGMVAGAESPGALCRQLRRLAAVAEQGDRL
eukprot:scaffold204_cov57-Phaeocystis_antarctica.AAC.1